MKATSTTKAPTVKSPATVETARTTVEATAPTVRAASAPTVAANATSLSTGARGQSQRQQQNYIEFAHKHPRLKPSTREVNVQTRYSI
jgi:hypothetical protein